MKAIVIDNTPHGYDVVIRYKNKSCIIHEGMYHKGYAKKFADDFNSALSSYVAKETEKLQAEIKELKAELEKVDYAYKNIEKRYNNAVTQVADMKAEVDRLKNDKWISVDERLPGKTDRYLVMLTYPEGGLDFAICVFYNDHRQYFDHFLEDLISHWHPLPQPTK